ncbi:hypothetical protein ACFL05_00735 [Patescibacteria group bacterium]
MNNNNTIIGIVVALAIGVVGGYFYGKNVGLTVGQQQILDQQTAEETAELEEIQEAVNPYAEIEDVANPFKDTYTNPFE